MSENEAMDRLLDAVLAEKTKYELAKVEHQISLVGAQRRLDVHLEALLEATRAYLAECVRTGTDPEITTPSVVIAHPMMWGGSSDNPVHSR